MGNKNYLIRLDDACPTMDKKRWDQIEEIFDRFGIKPLVGIIPANADLEQMIDKPDLKFWEKVKNWEAKGWSLALHGYDHCYISKEKGINPLWSRSEFAGVPLDTQKEKIRKGIAILKSHGITPKYFFAPSHTFDENTLEALRSESEIRIISDTIATKPYRQDDFIFIPQIGGSCRKMPINGKWTFCLHPSMMNDDNIKQTIDFIEKNSSQFIGFSELTYKNIGSINITSKLLRSFYFCYRTIRNNL